LSIETPWLRSEHETAVANVLEKLMHVVVPRLTRTSHGIAVAHDGRESSSRKPFLFREGRDYAISLTVEISDAVL
jgi:hypothetical protein